MATTARKPPPPCRNPGCREPSSTWAPVFGPHWTDDVGDYVERWGERPFCAEHGAEVTAAAVRRRLSDLLDPLPRMRAWTLATFPAADAVGAAALARARRWLEEDLGEWDAWLYVFGRVGSGKTSLALSCLRAFVEAHPFDEVAFCNVRQLLAKTRRSYGSKTASDPTEDLVEPWLVVLDDVGAERDTPWALETLATIVEDRYVRLRPTIVTSNRAPSELVQELGEHDPEIGERIVSRLIEDAVQIRLDRPNLRLKAAS
jgi:DNA replication protein DnaC